VFRLCRVVSFSTGCGSVGLVRPKDGVGIIFFVGHANCTKRVSIHVIILGVVFGLGLLDPTAALLGKAIASGSGMGGIQVFGGGAGSGGGFGGGFGGGGFGGRSSAVASAAELQRWLWRRLQRWLAARAADSIGGFQGGGLAAASGGSLAFRAAASGFRADLAASERRRLRWAATTGGGRKFSSWQQRYDQSAISYK
jgi:hypothetical protein